MNWSCDVLELMGNVVEVPQQLLCEPLYSVLGAEKLEHLAGRRYPELVGKPCQASKYLFIIGT